MHVVLWAFDVAPDRRAEFELTYGADGDWARLFAQSPDFRGTELLRDAARPGRYLTLDRWTTAGAFAAFRERVRTAYEALDRRCAALTVSETPLGAYDA